MMQSLRIKNIAIIDEAEISFGKGLNILSGETGAGKSIVLEAIALILGSRANTDLIRKNCDEGVVEALFDTAGIPWLRDRLQRLGMAEAGGELLIKRVVARSGRHRIYINGELATLTMLQELCDGLVDLCGQNEHQSLIKSQTQLELLDRYGGLNESREKYSQAFQHHRSLEKEHLHLLAAEKESKTKSDFVEFQLSELKNAQLSSGEDLRLAEEKKLLQSAESRLQAAESVRRALDDDEAGVLSSLRGALNRLRQACSLDTSLEPIRDGLERGIAEVEEASLGLHRYTSAVDLDPSRLETVSERLAQIANLRKKYGSTIEEMLETVKRLEKEFEWAQGFESRATEIGEQLSTVRAELETLGKKLSKARSKAGTLFEKTVTSELEELRMAGATFKIELSPRDKLEDWQALGADAIQFVVQTNRGEAFKPLGKIASGGELSRLMLAIRRVISDQGGIGVYLFDEIDAGIGGQTAFQVGHKLRSVAQYNQVICITHLPQVASFADHHLSVRKTEKSGRTLTEIVQLTPVERKKELARMLGGPELTKKSLENAAELIELAGR